MELYKNSLLDKILVYLFFFRAGSYDDVGEECIILTLNILQNLFVWLPVSTHLQPSVITIVFHWASVATQKKVNICFKLLNSMIFSHWNTVFLIL